MDSSRVLNETLKEVFRWSGVYGPRAGQIQLSDHGLAASDGRATLFGVLPGESPYAEGESVTWSWDRALVIREENLFIWRKIADQQPLDPPTVSILNTEYLGKLSNFSSKIAEDQLEEPLWGFVFRGPWGAEAKPQFKTLGGLKWSVYLAQQHAFPDIRHAPGCGGSDR